MQLCINLASEKLQQYFTTFMFKNELKLYEDEEIDYSSFAPKDNADVIALIEDEVFFVRLCSFAVNGGSSSD
jgi:myosin heavy subunit